MVSVHQRHTGWTDGRTDRQHTMALPADAIAACEKNVYTRFCRAPAVSVASCYADALF